MAAQQQLRFYDVGRPCALWGMTFLRLFLWADTQLDFIWAACSSYGRLCGVSRPNAVQKYRTRVKQARNLIR
jgi:hypothetical protein